MVLLQALGLDVCLHFLCLPLQTSDTVLVNELGEVVWQASGLDPERGNLIIEFIKLNFTFLKQIPLFLVCKLLLNHNE